MRATLAILAALASLSPALAQSTIVAPHPSDLIKEPGFREGWATTIKGEKFLPRDNWIARLAGPGSGAFYAEGGTGKQWIEGNSCQPHNCGDNHLVYLADPVTKKIYAVQRTRGNLPASQRFFGKPDETMRRLLLSRLMTQFP